MEQAAEATGDFEPDIFQIESASDLSKWGAYTLGNLIPTMATLAIPGGLGAKAGQLALGSRLGTGAAAQAGGAAGAWVGSTAMEGGHIYGDLAEEGHDRPLTALGFGTMAGALDAVPMFRLIGKFNRRIAEKAVHDTLASGIQKGLIKKAVSDVGDQIVWEGTTEGLQEFLSQSAMTWVDSNKELFTPEHWEEIANAMAAGALMGGVMGGAGATVSSLKAQEVSRMEMEREPSDDPQYEGNFNRLLNLEKQQSAQGVSDEHEMLLASQLSPEEEALQMQQEEVDATKQEIADVKELKQSSEAVMDVEVAEAEGKQLQRLEEERFEQLHGFKPVVTPEEEVQDAGENIGRDRKTATAKPAKAEGKRVAPVEGRTGTTGRPGGKPKTDTAVQGRKRETRPEEVVETKATVRTGEVLKNKDGSWRKNARGDISGAPEGVKVDKDIDRIVADSVKKMEAKEADIENSAGWYEKSGSEIRSISHGNKDTMEKMVRLMAILSAANAVGPNTTGAIKAMYQWARGEEMAAGRFPNQFKKVAEQAMTVKDFNMETVPKVDNKVMNFYYNLHDAAFQEDKYEFASTMDMWMARLFGYKTDALGPAQYKFSHMVTQRIADSYNKKHGTKLKPRQVQAALWVYAKNTRLIEEGKQPQYPSPDFATYITRAKQHITAEAVPSTSLSPLISEASYATRKKYTEEATQVLVDEKGNDKILEMLQAPLYEQKPGAGTFEGVVSPNVVTSVVGRKASPEFSTDVPDLYARIAQYVFSQDAVPWMQFDPTAKGATQGHVVRFSKAPSEQAQEAFYQHLREYLTDGEFTVVGNDIVVANFAGNQKKP